MRIHSEKYLSVKTNINLKSQETRKFFLVERVIPQCGKANKKIFRDMVQKKLIQLGLP